MTNLNVKNAARALIAGLALLLVSLPVFPQANQGTIQGSVFDQTGGAIIGATITVVDVARGSSRPLTSDSAGAYLATNLIPGMYSVRGEARGFQSLERSNILVEVGQTVRVDLVLQPGQQTQTVTVTSEAPAVNTTDATLGGTISQQAVIELPLNGRDFRNLLAIRPGVSEQVGGAIFGFSANGTRGEDVGYLIDGLRVDEVYTGSSVVNSPNPSGNGSTVFPVDAIQEINNEENPKAEVGWKPGAVVNMGLKSGTNGLHGTGFAFGRDDGMDARNYFNRPPAPKPPIAIEQFGGSAGGPIKKDKLFWFTAYEGLRYSVGLVTSNAFPTTVALGAVNSSNVTTSLVNACQDLVNQHKAISPLSAHIAGLNPATCAVAPQNLTPGPNFSVFPANSSTTPIVLGLVSTSRQDQGVVKVDYRLNDHNTINGLYFVGNGGIIGAPAYGLPGTSSSPFSGSNGAKPQLWSGAWNWTPSSTRVNEFRVGYDRFRQLYESVDANANPLTYGFNTGVTAPQVFGFPAITIGSFAPITGGQYKLIGPDGSLQFLDHYSIVHGNHTFKVGGEFIHNDANSYQSSTGKGSFSFTTLENFLQGIVNTSGNKIVAGNAARDVRNNEYALFAQDDWRISRKVTVNLGLRWEYNSVITEANNLLANFDPTQGLVQVGHQIGSLYPGDHKDFSPRVGLAWDLRGDGKTVVRAGGSLMYSYLPFITFVAANQSLGVGQDPTGARIITQQTGPAGVAGQGTINLASVSPNGNILTPGWQAQTAACVSGGTTACGSIFPQSIFNIQCGDGIAGDPSQCNAATVAPNFRNAYVGTWTLGIQRAITNNLSMDVAYVGTHGGDLYAFVNINQAALGSGFTPALAAAGDPSKANLASEQASRPFNSKFPYLEYIDQLNNDYRSNYNGLQVTMTERTSHGLSFLLGYTYSHNLDDDATYTNLFLPVNSTRPGFQYGNSDYDLRHRFTFTTTYALPGKKSRGQLLEGWQVNSLVTLQGSRPWSPVDLKNDFNGTGEENAVDAYGQSWSFAGNPSDFSSGPTAIPCWSGSSSVALAGCSLGKAGTTPAPAPCVAAASALSANAVASLNAVGCYVKGNSALIPPALGTDGNAGRNIFRGTPYYNWDMSLTKLWKFRERLSAQFRAEFFNVLNHPAFYTPGIALGTSSDALASAGQTGNFGCSCSTPDQARGNIVFGSGGSRAIQFGMKVIF